MLDSLKSVVKSRVVEAKTLILQKRSISADDYDFQAPRPAMPMLKRKSTMGAASRRTADGTGRLELVEQKGRRARRPSMH